MQKILIIGTLPPPIGGVAIHLYRLMKTLDSYGTEYIYYDYKKESPYSGLKKILKSQFIHTHFSNKRLRFFSIVFLKILNKKIILTFHGKYNFHNIFDKFSLILADHNFVLNNYSYENALKITKPCNLQMISAFIPPTDEENNLSDTLKKKLASFIKNKKVVACTNAHSYVLNKDGNDVYGIDFLLKIFSSVPDKCLIVSDPSGKLREHYTSYLKFGNILFISENHPFINILKISNVFVRATTSDGDSLSVREALYLNIKVIASDCVDRPKGCLIYKTGNEESFINCLDASIKHLTNKIEIENGATALVNFYQNIQSLISPNKD
ncbi:MAG: glycosyltransferase [Tannerella sp.]|jgi:hypothetical protein|nr:glycosyltransferase [Tannerella sp.]